MRPWSRSRSSGRDPLGTGSFNLFDRRLGVIDLAWYLPIQHGCLRTCEVRYLRLVDVDWENRRVRIEQPKGLKGRMVYMTDTTVRAVGEYLALRGPGPTNHVFLYRNQPLSKDLVRGRIKAAGQRVGVSVYPHRLRHTAATQLLSRWYCHVRLRTYAKRTGVRITPHQLRHSYATLLLKAGAPVLTGQTILGHKRIDTTLNYARLYDGTIAPGYYQAMDLIESRLALEDSESVLSTPGSLLVLVDRLADQFVGEKPVETLQTLRAGS